MKPLLAVVVLAFLGNTTSSHAGAVGTFTVMFLAVGQGDAALYRGPCGQVGLIDANRGSAPKVLGALDAAGSRHLTWISPSHYDADHLGDVVDVATAPGVSVQAVYDRGGDRNAKDSATYRTYYDWVTSGATTRVPVDIGANFSLCAGEEEVRFTVLSAGTDGSAAGGVPVSEENDRGLCLHVEYRSFNLATCGDINGTNEGSRTDVEAAVAGAFGDVEFAHINHHGSRFSSNNTYVSRLSAQASVVSLGSNAFGHPDPEVLARWRSVGEVYQTQASDGSLLDGDVTVSTDGTSEFSVMSTASGRSGSHPLDGSRPSDQPVLCLQSTSLSVDASPDAIVFEKTVGLHGRLMEQGSGVGIAGRPIILERRFFGENSFVPLATLVSDATGEVASFSKPGRSAEFRLRFEGDPCLAASSSPLTSVGIRPRISAKLDRTRVASAESVRTRVIIKPAHPGQRMKLQRRVNGRWRTVQAKVMKHSLVRFAIHPPSSGIFLYRALKSADEDHLATKSRVLRLSVVVT